MADRNVSGGRIFVISGPSGSGKGSICEILRRKNPDIAISVSATSREPRFNEVDGVSYHFITREKFEELIKNDEVLEHTQYNGNYYGTLKSEAEKAVNAGKDLILEIEVDGAGQIKRLLPDVTCSIMLIAPDFKEQERRLRGRGTQKNEAEITGRLEKAKVEIPLASTYDYIVVNETGHEEECADTVLSIMGYERGKNDGSIAEKHRYSEMKPVIDGYFD